MECAREIANEKRKTLLKMYAEKVKDGQTSFAAGIRFAITHLDLASDEEIHFALTGKTVKKKRKSRKKT